MIAKNVIKDLSIYADRKKAQLLQGFFKTGKGEYGEGDIFIGVVVPNIRIVAKKYKELSLSEIQKLLSSEIHEHRLTALLILTYKFPKANQKTKKEIVEFYLKNTKYINNWDLIDLSSVEILGQYFLEHPEYKKILFKFSKSKSLWERRISIISTFTLIRAHLFEDSLKIAETLLHDREDLIHKAVGWMLREIGKRDLKTEEDFLKKYYQTMPRTMLRYAIEKFPEQKRKSYLLNKI
jgi:3-methyladenine DNA glycosylase AlkD